MGKCSVLYVLYAVMLNFFGFGINLILILINFDSLFLLQMKHWTRFFTANKTFDTFFYCK